MTTPAIAGAIVVVALVGLLDSIYFVAVTYRWMRPDPRWLPNFCRLDGATCARIVDTPYARLLVLPNSVYGAAWYAIAVGAGIMAWSTGTVPVRFPLLVASAGTVLFSAILLWALLFRVRTPCPLCFVGHAANAALLALFLSA